MSSGEVTSTWVARGNPKIELASEPPIQAFAPRSSRMRMTLSASCRGSSWAAPELESMLVRVPAEGLNHGLSIDRQRGQPQPRLSLGKVGSIPLADSRQSQGTGRSIELGNPLQLLDRGHSAIALNDEALELSRSIALADTHGVKYRPPGGGTRKGGIGDDDVVREGLARSR